MGTNVGGSDRGHAVAAWELAKHSSAFLSISSMGRPLGKSFRAKLSSIRKENILRIKRYISVNARVRNLSTNVIWVNTKVEH